MKPVQEGAGVHSHRKDQSQSEVGHTSRCGGETRGQWLELRKAWQNWSDLDPLTSDLLAS
jgi:hypothetical protein